MKTNLHVHKLFAALLFGLAVGVSSCQREIVDPSVIGGGGTNGTGAKEKKVVLKLAVPPVSPSTRALTLADEQTISTLDALVFDVTSTNDTIYQYHVAAQPQSTTAGGATQTYTISLQVKTNSQLVLLLANAKDEVDDLVGLASIVGSKYGFVREALKVTVTATDGWDATTSTYKRLPMWGQSTPVVVTETMTTFPEQIPLLRMVAKVNVQVTTSVQSTFKLGSVHVFNTVLSGYIMSKDSLDSYVNMTPGTDYMKVFKPYVPKNAVVSYGPLSYTQPTDDTKMENEIYLNESDTTGRAYLTRTALVIGGFYNGSSSETYYRVDFYDNTSKTYMPVLRNHSYQFNITGVTGPGHPDPDTAFRSKSSSIIVSPIDWDDTGFPVVAFDPSGDMLGLNAGEFNLPQNAHDAAEKINTMVAKTTYVDPVNPANSGWYIESAVDSTTLGQLNWLQVMEGSSPYDLTVKKHFPAGDHGTALWFKTTANTTGAVRIALITVVAGNLRYTVKVRQSTIPTLTLVVCAGTSTTPISELKFAKAPSAGQTITVRWSPSDLKPRALVDQPGLMSGIVKVKDAVDEFNRNAANPANPGEIILEIFPGPITAVTAQTNILFVLDNTLTTVTKSLEIYQGDQYLTTTMRKGENVANPSSDNDRDGLYLIDPSRTGSNRPTFKLSTNYDWRASVVSATGDLASKLIDFTPLDGNSATDEVVPFGFKSDFYDVANYPADQEWPAEIVFRFDRIENGVSVDYTLDTMRVAPIFAKPDKPSGGYYTVPSRGDTITDGYDVFVPNGFSWMAIGSATSGLSGEVDNLIHKQTQRWNYVSVDINLQMNPQLINGLSIKNHKVKASSTPAPTFTDIDSVKQTGSPAKFYLHVPRLLYPNREIPNIKAIGNLYLVNSANQKLGNKPAYSIEAKQYPLSTTANFRAWAPNNGGQAGNYGCIGNAYFATQSNVLKNIFKSPGSQNPGDQIYYNMEADRSKPVSYIHVGYGKLRDDSPTYADVDYMWKGTDIDGDGVLDRALYWHVGSAGQSGDVPKALALLPADYRDGVGDDADLLWFGHAVTNKHGNLPDKAGENPKWVKFDAAIDNTAITQSRMLQFLLGAGTGKTVDISWGTDTNPKDRGIFDYIDDESTSMSRAEIASISSPTFVPLVVFDNNYDTGNLMPNEFDGRILLGIDPVRRFVYLGESQLFRDLNLNGVGPVGMAPKDIDKERMTKFSTEPCVNFYLNFMAYVISLASYGDSFGDMLDNATYDAPWDSNWGANAYPN